MQLKFEHTQKVTDGGNPAAYHSPDNVLQVFYTEGGRMYAVETETPMGEFDSRTFSPPKMAADEEVDHLKIDHTPRVRTYFAWLNNDLHRLAMLPSIALLRGQTLRRVTRMVSYSYQTMRIVKTWATSHYQTLRKLIRLICAPFKVTDVSKEYYGVIMAPEYTMGLSGLEYTLAEIGADFFIEEVIF